MALAALARRAWVRGDLLDAALALPRYVRDKVALTTAERQAARDQA
jgi:tRNA threonylcarbamoyladenosine biosynthesis protein TsaB